MSKLSRLLLTQLLLLCSLSALAVPGLGFFGNYAPSGGSGSSIAVDANSNSYVCGATSPFSGIFVSKISPTGAVVWTKTYATDRDKAAARSIALDPNGNVYVGGMISNGGNLDGLVVKYDNNGNFQWQAFYDDLSNNPDEFNQIAVDQYGSVYGVGYQTSSGNSGIDMITVKYDASGNFQWARAYDRTDGVGQSVDEGFIIRLDTNGDPIVIGNSNYIDFQTKTDHIHVIAIKYAPDGVLLDQDLIQEGTGDQVRSAALGKGNDVWIVMSSLHSQWDFELIKLTPALTEIWRNPFSPGAFNLPRNVNVNKITDEASIVGYSQDGSGNVFMTGALFDTDGNLVKDLGNLGPDDSLNDYVRTRIGSDGNIYTVGRITGHSLRAMKFAPDGTPIWTFDRSDSNASVADMSLGKFGDFFVTGGGNATGGVVVVRYRQVLAVADGTYTTPAGVKLTVDSAHGILSNDLYIAPDTQVSVLTTTVHGSINVLGDGSFNYIPATGYSGPDSFQYTVTNGSATSKATASLLVQSVLKPLQFAPSVIGGQTDTITATLSAPATSQSGPYTISLAYSGAAISGPATATVAVGSNTTQFTVQTSLVTQSEVDTVTASFQNISQVAKITINPILLQSLSLTTHSVFGGVSLSGTVNLNGAAPSGGLTVGIGSTVAAATPSTASLVVSAGSSAANLGVTTVPVTANQTGVIQASYNSTTLTQGLTVLAPIISSFSLTPGAIASVGTTTGKLSMTGQLPGGSVNVAIQYSAHTNGPASVTVGSTQPVSFTVTAKPVTSTVSETITASYASSTVNAQLTITAIQLSALTLKPTKVTGSYDSTGTVKLNVAATGSGASVTIGANSYLYLPATVKIAAGATSANFTIGTKAVSKSVTTNVTASFGGVTKAAALTLLPMNLANLAVNTSPVTGGTNSSGTVTLAVPAGQHPITVQLSSSNSAVAAVPGKVIVAAHKKTATFTITTHKPGVQTSVTITATIGASKMTATIIVK